MVRAPADLCLLVDVAFPSRQHTDLTSPKENYTGHKVDFKRNLHLSFSDYLHQHFPVLHRGSHLCPAVQYHSICAIPVAPVPQILPRRHDIILPVIPDETLERINAKLEKRLTLLLPIFLNLFMFHKCWR